MAAGFTAHGNAKEKGVHKFGQRPLRRRALGWALVVPNEPWIMGSNFSIYFINKKQMWSFFLAGGQFEWIEYFVEVYNYIILEKSPALAFNENKWWNNKWNQAAWPHNSILLDTALWLCCFLYMSLTIFYLHLYQVWKKCFITCSIFLWRYRMCSKVNTNMWCDVTSMSLGDLFIGVTTII